MNHENDPSGDKPLPPPEPAPDPDETPFPDPDIEKIREGDEKPERQA